MSLLDNKFKAFLAKEGLSPKSQETLQLLKRAYYSGATDFYHTTTNAAREAKLANPTDIEKRKKATNKALLKLTGSITQYWKEQLANTSKNGLKRSSANKPAEPVLKIVKK